MDALQPWLSREWLCTNGLGGFASSTLAGCNTRRYHGLLVAALEPPVGRTLLLSKLDETLLIGGDRLELATNEWHDGALAPQGARLLASAAMDQGRFRALFRGEGWEVEKQVWLEQGQNTTFVRYLLTGRLPSASLELLPLCACRDFHAEQRGTPGWQFASGPTSEGWRVQAYEGAPTLLIDADGPLAREAAPAWYWQFLHRAERERGLDCLEDLFRPAILRAELRRGEPLLLRASAEPEPAPFSGALERQREHTRLVLAGAEANSTEGQLRLAGDAFVARRSTPHGPGHTIIAGYHWFSDWGRDTMISLPGLLLATGRHDTARQVLATFAGLIDQGLLPNTFNEQGGAEYNNADATLWFFHALDRYLRATEDNGLLRQLFPALEDVVRWHLRGTRHGIHVDPADGLLFAGEPGIQVTWMDAKVDDWVVTPRIGKPVEINALWFNALCLMSVWARDLHAEDTSYGDLSRQAGASFRERFWFAQGRHLYDVIDGPEGPDSSLRPNQVLALALPFSPLFGAQAAAVLEAVTNALLTPLGLRTLAPDDPKYLARYGGDRRQRDGAYHQGAVWPWLMGPYLDAHLRIHRDPAAARALLAPLLAQLSEGPGLGCLCELFDGDTPHAPGGCIAQAWSTAEALRVWSNLHRPVPPAGGPEHLSGGEHARD
ncbi:MAG TPA: amylo-alpha-1,6-glucosidase [Chloroflexota bacterium]|nr:amylo-alpha-1,6-glucosidase [Chloroflexota bacterium]